MSIFIIVMWSILIYFIGCVAAMVQCHVVRCMSFKRITYEDYIYLSKNPQGAIIILVSLSWLSFIIILAVRLFENMEHMLEEFLSHDRGFLFKVVTYPMTFYGAIATFLISILNFNIFKSKKGGIK